ncbi:bifunctional 2-polyprenyl-6-hydroxyphenol methylase/3-demethylubiquinol 3-O-methyltransferase UbiG [Chitinophaga sp. S165]|uniref:class I SAM-dependent methyltransferase n=1 Tax=Chitinophaga sp. S165 TaxID=2135462 RepID=UPI000D719429|nr:class I SAM-dependent methyltransferase [Chitinophaga sp. S165]PWV55631.1 methyltransferase family protein [Chitinophaga sp. S165]
MDIRTLWNERYTKGLPSLETPDPFFIRMFDQIISREFPAGGNAIDLAAGTGRHTLHLAEAKWKVTAVDISDVALERLVEQTPDVQIRTICTDLATYQLPQAAFDLVVLYYYFDRSLFPAIIQAVKPGGLLICKLAVGKPANPIALQEQELLQLTNMLDTASYEERPVKDRGVAEYAGRKPF